MHKLHLKKHIVLLLFCLQETAQSVEINYCILSHFISTDLSSLCAVYLKSDVANDLAVTTLSFYCFR